MLRTSSSVVPRLATAVAALAMLVACATDPTAAISDVDPSYAKGGGSGGGSTTLAVTAVEPAFAHQGETLANVKISGSGFNASATATWERGGSPDARITVLATRYVSSTEIRADVSIDGEADLALYDVAVTITVGLDRKKGVGIELFEVTTAQTIGTLCTSGTASGFGRAINDAGQIVGQSCGLAFFWSQSTGMVNLGTGIAEGIDEAGNVVAGLIGGPDIIPVIWTRDGGAWVRSELPRDGQIGRVNALASDADGNASILGGRLDVAVGKKTYRRPAMWFRDGSGWRLQRLPLPAGVSSTTEMIITDVNANGQGVSRLGPPAVWDPVAGGGYIATLLPNAGNTMGISDDGNIVVGNNSSYQAAYWRRNADGSWSGPTALRGPCPAPGQSWVNAVNTAGIFVGRSCNGGAAWKVTETGIVEIRLSGLGRLDSSQEAWDVNNTVPARAAGNGTKTPVYWDLPF